METLGDLLAAARRGSAPAARADGEPTVEYGREPFVTTAWKTANFFSLRRVHAGATVAVVDDAAVPAALALFGAAGLGATVRFAPPVAADAALLVGPGDAILEFDVPPGTTRVAYTAGTDDVADPSVDAFGRSVWSENPVEPPESVDPDAPVLETAERSIGHADLLDAADGVADGLEAGDEVVVRGPLADPGVVVAGVLAPLRSGATVVFPDGDTVGDVAVGDDSAPEARVVSPALP